MIRIIVAGSRDFNDFGLVDKTLTKYMTDMSLTKDDIEIVSGCARGADKLGEQFATKHNIACAKFPAEWDRYGKSAGYRRNAQMADYAIQETGVLFAFWDGSSKGTKHMIDLATTKGMNVNVVNYKIPEPVNEAEVDVNDDKQYS